MKNLIFILFIALSFSASAQLQFEAASSGGGFNVSSGVDINQTIMVDGTSYDIFETAKGSKYIICNSPKTGNDYPVWIGTATNHSFEGREVRQSKSDKYFILIKSKNTGNPYAKYLKTK